MMKCGLLGAHLGHSQSPRLHAMLGSYSYELFEVAPEELDAFLRSDAFDALNVTIPYKRAVVPYCAALSDAAKAIGSVNTLLRQPDGTLYGDNTDYASPCCCGETAVSTPVKRPWFWVTAARRPRFRPCCVTWAPGWLSSAAAARRITQLCPATATQSW